ncbi:hypothetical protein [Methanococcoides seepicolus]|uniref:Uncharacterized protein n=1 Tax=Methanococcoides seepicolus TaxID=2828780 RepID=A0A9E4ZGY1_9EURY|nr:hypothetical protein [Methanococcoides seepicolus]MCM1987482.1 hypothetical protein [Methanococcoides seepicolus]
MKKIMEEYTEIVNDNIYTQSGKWFCDTGVFEELKSFWLSEYQNLVDKLGTENNELRTYHICQTSNDLQNIIERSSLFADRIIIPDMTVLMGIGLTAEHYQYTQETVLGFLSVISELTDWINEGIVVVVPNRLNGALNYSMDQREIKRFFKVYYYKYIIH